MRPLAKSAPPAILVTNGHAWTAAYEQAITEHASAPVPWRHPQVAAALSAETLKKCAYCEAVITDVSYAHVEHILPKSARPDLVVDWNNLTLACPVCNVSKGDYHSPEAPLLNPYRDPLAMHLAFRGPAIVAHLDSAAGERTIVRIDLMRPPLLMERMKRIEALHNRLKRWHDAEGPDKDMFADLVREAVGDESEFAQCLEEYAVSIGFPL